MIVFFADAIYISEEENIINDRYLLLFYYDEIDWYSYVFRNAHLHSVGGILGKETTKLADQGWTASQMFQKILVDLKEEFEKFAKCWNPIYFEAECYIDIDIA